MSSQLNFNGQRTKASPIIAALGILAFINWFVFFGVSIHLGGDAMGVLPSVDDSFWKITGTGLWLQSRFGSPA
jgi:hypothetical protein